MGALFIQLWLVAAPPRLLLLPAAPPLRQLEQRLAGALGGSFTVITRADLEALAEAQALRDTLGCSTSDCLVALGSAVEAERLLRLELLGDRLFVTVYEAGGAPLVRRELPAGDLSARLAAQIAAWVSGRPAELPTRVQLSCDGSPLCAAATAEVTERFVKLGALIVQESPDVVASLDVHALRIDERRHHVHRYLDGRLDATLRVARGDAIVFSETANVTTSRRARYASREAVQAELVSAAADRWVRQLMALGVVFIERSP
jgi:hypothetical protein